MVRHFFVLLLLLILAGFNLIHAQYKGDKYFNKRLYVKARDAYSKESRNKKDPALLSKQAETYYILQEYNNALSTYRSFYPDHFSRETDFLNYAMCLKINGDYDNAAQVYELFLKKYPNSTHFQKVKKFCTEIKYWNTRPKEYEVTNCRDINTEKSEFSSVVFQKKLYFTAEKSIFNSVFFYKDESHNRDFYDLYSADIHSLPKNPKNLKGSANSDFHDACLTISSDGKWAALSRSDLKGNAKLKKPQIYLSEFDENKIKKIKLFDHCRPEYLFTHPSLGKNGNLIFFSSDMPGGYGGTDIWYCEKVNNTWNKPINAGPDVNSPGNEVFPYYREDGTLFFASDGHPGFGGLDLYAAHLKNNTWIVHKHETMHLNSSYDDFGICFATDTTGFFASNRPGGKGSDDIYYFSFKNLFIEFSGFVFNTENTNDPAMNVKVTLTDSLGTPLQETTTDNNGYFVFKNLDASRTYMAYIDNPDPKFSGKARYFMADNSKTIHRVSSSNTNHPFVFKHLPIQKNALPELYTDDNLVLAGNLLYGENPSKALKNTKIRIKNDFGDVVEETTTNEFGAFTFKFLPANQTYMVEIVESDIDLSENTKITLTNRSGKELKNFYYSKNKQLFKILPAEKSLLQDMYAPDEDLIMTLAGFMYDQNKKPLSNVKLIIFSEKNPSERKEIISGTNGRFEFKNLEADKNYIFQTADNDPLLQGVEKIYLADHRGRIYKILHRDSKGGFVYKILPADKTLLGEYVVDDPWLQVLELKYKKQKEALTIVENIYYGINDHKFDAAGQIVLDKVIQILKENPNLNIELSSHTDSRAGDAYNLKLSQKRAQFAVDYIISKGIDKKRMKAVGFGETRLLNRCANGVDCSEEEHKINRRTEFKIVDTSQPASK